MDNADLIIFQDKFSRDIKLRSQQKEARTQPWVDNEPDAINGRFFYYQYEETTEPIESTGYAEASPDINILYDRRRGFAKKWHWGKVYDDNQLRKLVENPQAKTKVNVVNGFNRSFDRIVLAAAIGNSVSVNEQEQVVLQALPASQKLTIAGGWTGGLNLTKLNKAREIFDRNEIVEEDRVMFVGSQQLTNLLDENKVGSSDYNTVKALVKGEVDSFLSFTFVRLELLPKFDATTRQAIAMSRGAVGTYSNEVVTKMGALPKQSFANQLYMERLHGANRNQEAHVLEIQCTETA